MCTVGSLVYKWYSSVCCRPIYAIFQQVRVTQRRYFHSHSVITFVDVCMRPKTEMRLFTTLVTILDPDLFKKYNHAFNGHYRYLLVGWLLFTRCHGCGGFVLTIYICVYGYSQRVLKTTVHDSGKKFISPTVFNIFSRLQRRMIGGIYTYLWSRFEPRIWKNHEASQGWTLMKINKISEE